MRLKRKPIIEFEQVKDDFIELSQIRKKTKLMIQRFAKMNIEEMNEHHTKNSLECIQSDEE